MSDVSLAMVLSVVAALCFAGVVTITQHASRFGKRPLVVRDSCGGATLGRRVIAALVAAAAVMAVAGVVGHRERSRLQ